MTRPLFVATILGLSLSVGCTKTEQDAPYRQDLDRICHAIEHSGSEGLDQQAQAIQVAQWLGANLATDEGRKFSIELTTLDLEARRERLSAEAEKFGIHGCSLLDGQLSED